MTTFKNIVLTGASGGLGSAMVDALAGPDCAFLLFGRNAQRLERVTKRAETAGAEVQVSQAPMENYSVVANAIEAFDHEHPVDLFIANAGVKCGNTLGVEPVGQAGRIVDVNLTGTIEAIQSILPAMQRRRSGRIAIVSSLAARSPQGCLLSYSATKAAVAAYGVGLRRRCRGTGVGVSVIFPGFVATPMTDRHRGPTPFVLSPERAASLAVRGLEAGRRTIAFPWQLVWLTRLQHLVPPSLADVLSNRLDAEIEPDRDQLASAHRERDALDLKGER